MTQQKTKTKETEVVAKPKRRTFSAADKQRILRAVDELAANGVSPSALLRREGIYRSQLSDWRRALASEGKAGLEPARRGPKPKSDAETSAELRKRDRRIATLERQLAQAEILLDLQKKVMLLAELRPSTNDEALS
jgi:transposase